ncbi:MAG: glycosyltransferase, partial [Alphaproteobacteria bacterium]|nr:glycosyltransferase [Alphaproteobacteria bacterium]
MQAVLTGLCAHLRTEGVTLVESWPDSEEGPEEWRLGFSVLPTPLGGLKAGRDLTALAGRLARFRPETVMLHFPTGQALYFAALKPLFGYRLVLCFHGSDLLAPRPMVRRVLPALMRRADAVSVVSEPLRAAAHHLCTQARVRLVENGIDTAFWGAETGTPADPAGLVVAAGRLQP